MTKYYNYNIKLLALLEQLYVPFPGKIKTRDMKMIPCTFSVMLINPFYCLLHEKYNQSVDLLFVSAQVYELRGPNMSYCDQGLLDLPTQTIPYYKRDQ